MSTGIPVFLLQLAVAGFLMAEPSVGESNLVRNCWRNLTPDARAKLAVWRESAAAWRPQTARPQMFVRGQFFYGNERDHYIHSWYERPLHQDSSMQSANERGRMLNPLSWARTVRTAREMHLDGFAFFPGNPGCWDVVPRSVLPGSEIPLLPEFHNGDRGNGIAHCLDSLARIREMPNAFRINGRIVITCYPVMSWSEKGALDFWPEPRPCAAISSPRRGWGPRSSPGWDPQAGHLGEMIEECNVSFGITQLKSPADCAIL